MDIESFPELATKRGGLRFVDDGIESAYREHSAQRSLPFFRIAVISSTIAWFAAVVFCWWVRRDLFVSMAVAVFGVQYPLMGTVFVVIKSARWPRLHTPLAMANNLSAAFIVIVILQFQARDTLLALPIFIIVQLTGFIALRLSLRAATICGAIALGAYHVALSLLWHQTSITDYEIYVVSTITWNATAIGAFYAYIQERTMRDAFVQDYIIDKQAQDIERRRRQADDLLLNILPPSIAATLKTGAGTIAQHHDDVTVVFADLVGFTPLSTSVSAKELVDILNEIFTRFDEMSARLGVEKIKTIGDAYMAVAGLPKARDDHADVAVTAALEMLSIVDEVNDKLGTELAVRVGVYSGPVVAGVIGKRKFAYDLWGDVVNTAARMESHGVAGAVHIGESTKARLSQEWSLEPRGEIPVKGKGTMTTWLLTR